MSWFGAIRNRRALTIGVVVTIGTVLGVVSPALAALSNTSLVMSNNQVSSSSTYTTIFSTGSAAVTDLIVMLPSTVSGLSASNVTVQTATGCTGTFSTATLSSTAVLSGETIGLPISIPTLGTCVKVIVTGLTNPSSAGTLYACMADGIDTTLSTDLTAANLAALSCTSSGITSSSLTSALLGALVADSASIGLDYVAQATNGTTTALNVAPALNFAVNSAYQAFNVTPTSTGVEASNASQALSVATNAQSYTVQGLLSGTSSALTWEGGSGHTIPFGYTESTGGAAPSCTGSGAAFGVNGTYSAIQSSVAGLTNGQTTNVNYCWNVSFTEPAGQYEATVTYLVVPSF